MTYFLAILLLLAPLPSHAEPDSFPIPEGFVLQSLDPTNGKIARPRDWHYSSKGTPSGWMWTISAEDPAAGGYETGLRMQVLVGIQKQSHRSTEEFAVNFLRQKYEVATVLQECPSVSQGRFMRQCLEVLEDIVRPQGKVRYHLLYSVFWSDKMDIVVVTTFGAPPEKWESVKGIVDGMSNVELIGPNFGKRQGDR